jgi:hypothetical protein
VRVRLEDYLLQKPNQGLLTFDQLLLTCYTILVIYDLNSLSKFNCEGLENSVSLDCCVEVLIGFVLIAF